MTDPNERFTATHHAVSRIGEILCQMDMESYIADLQRAYNSDDGDPLLRALAKDNLMRMISFAEGLLSAQKAREAIREHVDDKVNLSNAIAAAVWVQNLSA